MKNLFIFLNIILFVCVVFLFMLHFSHKSPPPEKVLKQTPEEPNIQVPSVFPQKKKNLSSTEIALISGNDLFSPARGVDPSTLKPKKTGKKIKHSQLELTGIYKMGSMKGAIISTVSNRSSSLANKKKIFTVGDKIGDTAYVLQDINPEDESVVVSMGTSQFILKLEREDPGSLNRRTKGEAASQARASMSATKPAHKRLPTQKPTAARSSSTPKRTPVKPKNITTSNRRSAGDMRKIRQEILKKMRNKAKK